MYCGEDGSRLKGQWTNDRFLGQRVTPAESCEFSFDMAAFTKNNSAYSNDPERCNHAVNLIIQRHNRKIALYTVATIMLEFIQNLVRILAQCLCTLLCTPEIRK